MLLFVHQKQRVCTHIISAKLLTISLGETELIVFIFIHTLIVARVTVYYGWKAPRPNREFNLLFYRIIISSLKQKIKMWQANMAIESLAGFKLIPLAFVNTTCFTPFSLCGIIATECLKETKVGIMLQFELAVNFCYVPSFLSFCLKTSKTCICESNIFHSE